jgi:ABC transport system ATP-binding/permease protein
MEREDYRRAASPNVFFGTKKTYHPFGHPPASTPATGTGTGAHNASPKPLPWWRELTVDTLWLNFGVMMLTLFLVLISVFTALRRQLSRV